MRLLPFGELSAADLDTWHRVRQAGPALDSPYFHPAFAAAVDASGTPVHVVVGDGVFMAGHREGRLLRPAGWPGADFQGPVVAEGAAFDPLDLLVGGVAAVAFDHLVDGLPGFERWTISRAASPYIEVGAGWKVTSGALRGRGATTWRRRAGARRRRDASWVSCGSSPTAWTGATWPGSWS